MHSPLPQCRGRDSHTRRVRPPHLTPTHHHLHRGVLHWVYDCAPTPPRPKAHSRPREGSKRTRPTPSVFSAPRGFNVVMRAPHSSPVRSAAGIPLGGGAHTGCSLHTAGGQADRQAPLLRRPQTNQTPSNTTSGPPPAGQQRGSPRFFLSGRVWPRGNAARGAARGKGG
jgi:hypothetical protein